MMTQEEIDLLTRTGPGTPCGEFMRRYWQPVALSEELAEGRPLTVRLLGEDLVLFRDDQRRLGLIGLHCSHRGGDLSYGRLEDGGLRCIYHGWLYNIYGQCLDQPGEPEGGRGKDSIRHQAYPCQERVGIIFAYMGPGEPPALPGYGFLTASEDHVFATRHFVECNYLQGTEGSADVVHLSFLHYNKFSQAVGPFSSRGAAPTVERVEADLMDSGFRICKIRKMESGNHIFVATFLLPTIFSFNKEPDNVDEYIVNWHVPIDDTHYWEYAILFDRKKALDKEELRKEYMEEMTPDYKPIRNNANRYLQDRASMKTESFSGMGFNFDPQDICVLEGMGPIQDRTKEHLVSSDLPTLTIRKLFMRSIKEVQEGRDAPRWVRDDFPDIFAYRGPIPSTTNWKEHCRQLAAKIS